MELTTRALEIGGRQWVEHVDPWNQEQPRLVRASGHQAGRLLDRLTHTNVPGSSGPPDGRSVAVVSLSRLVVEEEERGDAARGSAAERGAVLPRPPAPACGLIGDHGPGCPEVDTTATPAATKTASASQDDEGDRGLWGLAGLLGLAGLAGLKRRNDSYDRTSGATARNGRWTTRDAKL